MTERIGSKTLEETVRLINGVLTDYRQDINDAYIRVDDALTVRLPVEFKPEGDGVAIEVGIAFYTGQVKYLAKGFASEKQGNLFDHAEQELARRREILWRSFEPLRKQLLALELRMKRLNSVDPKFRRFELVRKAA